MRAQLGIFGLVLGVVSCALGVGTLGLGIARHDDRLLRVGRRYVFALLAGAVVAVVAMEWALLSHDFSIKYVADNNARATPLLFTITGLWAALEGSILLWGLILAGFLAATAYKFRTRATDPLVAWATLTGLVVAFFFFLLMLIPANPFRTFAGATPIDGRGPNPLLQNHPLMAFHPPMLYLGYVGFTVPFSFAIAALVTGRFGEGWLADTRRATLLAWGFLTIGIILGAWWSYEVLGWGGYWAWDPVENASLLPWLTGTAFIHSVMVQERRGMLRVWNLSLVIATFCLTILGTFLTRSGIVNSVHSFTQSPIGPWLLGFLAFSAVVGIGLVAWRGDKLHAPGRIDSPRSREAAFLANNLVFAGLAFVVLLGTVFPLIAEALNGKQLSVGEPYFDRMTTPLGIALLFLMAAAPALPWRAASGDVLRRRLVVPAYVGGASMLLALLLGARGIADVLAFGLAGFALAGVARQVWIGVRARRRAHGENPLVALHRAVRNNPRLYGGLLVHVGVIVVAVALAASQSYTTKREVRLREGESATVQGYKVTYLGTRTERSAQKTTTSARVRIHKGGDDLGVYAPAVSSFPNANEGIGTPSVRTGLLNDVYLTLVSSPTEQGRVTLGVQITPFALWLWLGGGIMAAGTVVALSPSIGNRFRRVRRERAPDLLDAGPDGAVEPEFEVAAR
ncbi:MAG TPA: heme lyase CcmF/NrfE family subunit [Acidimicrobiia bacterium]|nr:heme lyase CcmF/NrfE family subunit [Acidimicrobiia bacterium]